jgi:hypothetical protein
MPGRWAGLVAIVAAIEAAVVVGVAGQGAPALDFEFYRQRVEPLFLSKRPGHTRCYVCHAQSNNAFNLEKLAPGQTSWSEEQSRRNFAIVAKLLVTPGAPDASRLLLHPLAPEGGGDIYHSGGRQFASKSDPDWTLLAQWVNGARLGGGAR